MQPDSERPPGTPDSCGLLIQPGWLVFNNDHAVTHAEDCLPAHAIVFAQAVVLRSSLQSPKQVLFRIDCPVRSDISTGAYCMIVESVF